MGGSLSAQSDGPGKGAVFTLQVPIHRDNEGDGHTQAMSRDLNA
jgi:hypothetical protein